MINPLSTAPHPREGPADRGGPRARLRLAVLVGIAVVLGAVAVARISTFLKGQPARDHVRRGIVLAEAARLDEAEHEWRSAVRLDPGLKEPYQLLSKLYLDTGRPDLAVPLLEQLRKTAPDSPHTLCRLSEAYTRSERTRDGLAAARQAVVLEPHCARAHALLGIYLGDQGDRRGAITELSRAVALAPDDDTITISLAQAQLDTADFAAAETTAKRVVERNPSYALAHYTLGMAFARRTPTPENLRRAIAALSEATKRDPEFADAFRELGRLQLLAGDNRGAIVALERLWSRGARDQQTAFNLTTAYRKIGDGPRAGRFAAEYKRLTDFSARYDALRKRRAADPTNLDVALQLAEAEIASNKPEEALPLVNQVLRSRPSDAQALRLAGDLYDRLGQPQIAAALRQRLNAGHAGKDGG
jgi:tetratricopeptide (TPR) repeat protein